MTAAAAAEYHITMVSMPADLTAWLRAHGQRVILAASPGTGGAVGALFQPEVDSQVRMAVIGDTLYTTARGDVMIRPAGGTR